MTNYFYYDANGKKQGPFSEQYIRELAAKEAIIPDTLIESEGSPEMVRAGHICGCFSHEQLHGWVPGKTATLQSTSWQFNFETHLFICRLVFTLSIVVAIAAGIFTTRRLLEFGNAFPDAGFQMFIGIIGTWLCVFFSIAATRLICEWSLITSKAAQIYLERCTEEQKE